jgi:hypothetical protein
VDAQHRPGTPVEHLGRAPDRLDSEVEHLPEVGRVVDAVDEVPGRFVEHEQVRAAACRELLGGRHALPVDRVEVEMVVQDWLEGGHVRGWGGPLQ